MKIEVNLQGSSLKAEDVKEQHVTDVISSFFKSLNGDVPKVSEPVVTVKEDESLQDKLQRVNNAIATIETTGQLYQHGTNRIVRADLKLLYDRQAVLQMRVNAEKKRNEKDETAITPGEIVELNSGEKISVLQKLATIKDSGINNKPSKTIEKINSARTLNVSVGERIEKNAEETPKHWETGVKETEEGPRYQCKYWCDCGHHGKRWVKQVTRHVHCHECNGQIVVEGATLNTREDGLPEQDSFGNFYIAREMKLDGDESIV